MGMLSGLSLPADREMSLWLLHLREDKINKSMIIQRVVIMIKSVRCRFELEIHL